VRGLTVDVDVQAGTPQMLHSDLRLVRLVIVNLLERAISVSPEGHISIVIQGDDGRVRIRVHDTGPGLTDEEREEVFDPLEQPRDLHRRSGAGSGLGVYALRDIAAAIGGEIGHEPGADDGGNVFVFEVSHPAADARPWHDTCTPISPRGG
jgi:signal transduction histidine kinase